MAKRNRKTQPRKKKQKAAGGSITNKVFAHMQRNPGQAFTVKTLTRKLNLTGKNRFDQVEEALEDLRFADAIQEIQPGLYKAHINDEDTVIGTFEFVNPRFGFVVVPDQEEDIKISSSSINGAMQKDKVRVAVFKKRSGPNPEGEIVEVLERGMNEVLCTVERAGNKAFGIPDNKRMHQDIFLVPGQGKRPFNGDKVLVKITKWPEHGRNPEGEIVQVLGEAGKHEVEMNAIMIEYDLDPTFPQKVLTESEGIPAGPFKEDVAARRDMRDITTFTIDPFDAKDFDDALSMQKTERNTWEIGVHIADVTHYVKEGTALEAEAVKRATSVYLVDRVIPMLPERLSNELCSLRPHEDKLTFSAVFELNEVGTIIHEWFGRTIIHSDRRFTYEEAQEILETGEGDFAEEIKTLNELAHALRKERFRKGSIAFETAEVKFRLDEDGKPLEVIPKVRKDAHKLIEDFMLLANKRVAEFVFKQKEKGAPKTMVYRVHENPNLEKLESFATFAGRFGYNVRLDPENIAEMLNDISKKVEGKPEENILQSLAIRSMAKAKYTTETLGHFGLGFEHYSHFTSPIRRYPDMMAHRLLQRYLDKGKSADEDEFEDKCEHSSEREKLAAEAERASIKYKQVEFMSSMLGEEFEGIVTGVTDFGVFVEITATKCEGMIRVSDLDDDYYEYDPDALRLTGRSNGKMITFGDKLLVKVANTDMRQRTIDLEFLENKSD